MRIHIQTHWHGQFIRVENGLNSFGILGNTNYSFWYCSLIWWQNVVCRNYIHIKAQYFQFEGVFYMQAIQEYYIGFFCITYNIWYSVITQTNKIFFFAHLFCNNNYKVICYEKAYNSFRFLKKSCKVGKRFVIWSIKKNNQREKWWNFK